MKYLQLIPLIFFFILTSCSDEVRDITGGTNPTTPTNPGNPPNPTAEINPVDINASPEGFNFLSKMQGHWVGNNLVIADDYPWFAWDYRAISPSHIHGIHEGGTNGNLFTSFFVTNYKGKRTIMARNGGVLNGIYRTSYFVMDKVEDRNSEGIYYRLVDAIGGDAIMYMELRFKQDSLYFNAYTSNLGNRVPSRHMTFKGTKMHTELAQTSATATGFPQNVVDPQLDFVNGFNTEYLYVESGATEAKSATFLAQQNSNDVYQLAPLSGDPYTIVEHPRLGTLTVNVTRNNQISDANLLVYLSRDPLTDTNGYLTSDASAYDTILHFPMLTEKENTFLFTYLHPGEYFVTIVADLNNDFGPSQGDVLSISKKISIAVEENKVESITNINVQN